MTSRLIALVCFAVIGAGCASGSGKLAATTVDDSSIQTTITPTPTPTTLTPVEVTTATSFQTAGEVITAMEVAGFRCQEVVSIFDDLDNPYGSAFCDLSDALSVSVLAYLSEQQRLIATVSGIVVGCAAGLEPGQQTHYIYGPGWIVGGWDPEASDLGFATELASALGGTINDVECGRLVDLVFEIEPDADWSTVVDGLDEESLRRLLGE